MTACTQWSGSGVQSMMVSVPSITESARRENHGPLPHAEQETLTSLNLFVGGGRWIKKEHTGSQGWGEGREGRGARTAE